MRTKTYNDRQRYEFITNFGFHNCHRDKSDGTLILHCRSNNSGNTVSVNRAAREAFLAFEPQAPHRFHLETPDRSGVFDPGQLQSPVLDWTEYSVFNIDELNAPPDARAEVNRPF